MVLKKMNTLPIRRMLLIMVLFTFTDKKELIQRQIQKMKTVLILPPLKRLLEEEVDGVLKVEVLEIIRLMMHGNLRSCQMN